MDDGADAVPETLHAMVLRLLGLREKTTVSSAFQGGLTVQNAGGENQLLRTRTIKDVTSVIRSSDCCDSLVAA